MDIIERKNTITKPEIQKVQKQKQEYKLIDQFVRRRGMKLFSYNQSKDELKEILPSKKDAIDLSLIAGKQFESSAVTTEEVNVDSRNIHFEALNMKNAIKRLERYKSGKISDLCNLRSPGKIDWF